MGKTEGRAAEKTAFIFTGQGSQFVGMGQDFYNNFSVSREIFDRASDILKRDIKKLCFEGPAEALSQTINTQVAILTMTIAALEALKKEAQIKPEYLAGHSLGEYAALYCAGVLSFENVLSTVQKRAELMSGIKGGKMAAVLGLEAEKIENCLEKVEGYVEIANYNTPLQSVITGENEAIEKAGEVLKQNGAKRFIPLEVSGAFHSKLMKGAGLEFATFVSTLEIDDAQIPVITNVDASETTDRHEFSGKMPLQIYSPVFWHQSVEMMILEGVNKFIEIGPKPVLTGMNKKISTEIQAVSVCNVEDLKQLPIKPIGV